MTTDDTDIIEELPPDQPQDIGPGDLLGRKREALGLGIRQVADDLHITMHYVKALESNAFDKLPGDVFVRGYIRSYANLLHLDPQIIINLYDEYTQQNRGSEEQAFQVLATRRGDRNLPWVLVSGVAFVVIAVALWFFGAGGSDSSLASNAVQRNAPGNGASAATLENVGSTLATDPVALFDAPAPAPAVTRGNPVLRMSQDQLEELPSGDESAPVSTEAATIAELAPADEAAATAAELSAPEEAPAAQGLTPDELAAVPESAPAAELPAAQEAPAAAREAVVADAPVLSGRLINIDAGGADVLQIVFNGVSSVQVDDGTDKQIYRDTRGAGDVLRITGSVPFDISLGDAGAVELSLNGNPVEFRSSIRTDNSARLTIGL